MGMSGVVLMASRLTPNKAEKEWASKVASLGCIVCLEFYQAPTPAEIHHIVGRSGVNGHLLILPLCHGHHRKGGDKPPFISRHPYKKRFVTAYGSEFDLFEKVCSLLGEEPEILLKGGF